MVTALSDEEGANRTERSFVATVDRLAAKYLRAVCFYSGGKVAAVLLGNPSDFQEYLHILADEIPQVAARVLGLRCRVGVSRTVCSLTELHDAYRRPWKPCARAAPRAPPSLSGTWPRRSRAGKACASGRWRPSASITGGGPVAGVPERHAGCEPQPSERLHQEIRGRDLYQHQHAI